MYEDNEFSPEKLLDAFNKTLAVMNRHHQQSFALTGALRLMRDVDESQQAPAVSGPDQHLAQQQTKTTRGRSLWSTLRRFRPRFAKPEHKQPDTEAVSNDGNTILVTAYHVVDEDAETLNRTGQKEQ